MIGSPRTRAAAAAVVLGGVMLAITLTGNGSEDPIVAAQTAEVDLPPTDPDVTGAPGAPDLPDLPDLPDRGEHLPLVGIDGWLQSEVTSLEELRGNVVAVQFWTFGCRNCKNTLPHMQALHENYADEGFEIVGVHAPEFDFEADVGNIEQAAAELGVTWPIVLDTNKQTFHSWQDGPTGYWPRIYLLDRDGHIRYDKRGEGRYDEIDAAVRALLAET
jgi:thiol-disulfide isomerase/thioredoxin